MSTDTARLRALLEAATPRPWKGDRYDGTIKYSVLGGEEGQYYVFSINHSPGEDFDADVFNYGDEDETLMLEAVNALPGLIEEVERLKQEVKRWYEGAGQVGDVGIRWMEKAKALEETIHEIQRDRLQETALLEWVAEELGCEDGNITESLRKQTAEVERLRAALAWRPLEDAPLNTTVLLQLNDLDSPVIFAWKDTDGWYTEECDEVHFPAFWMPIPKPREALNAKG